MPGIEKPVEAFVVARTGSPARGERSQKKAKPDNNVKWVDGRCDRWQFGGKGFVDFANVVRMSCEALARSYSCTSTSKAFGIVEHRVQGRYKYST
eukprot:scaffold164418_cov30-Prasinocladus_malaysianus.AAC.1